MDSIACNKYSLWAKSPKKSKSKKKKSKPKEVLKKNNLQKH